MLQIGLNYEASENSSKKLNLVNKLPEHGLRNGHYVITRNIFFQIPLGENIPRVVGG